MTDLYLAPDTDAVDGRYVGFHLPLPERILDAVAAVTGVSVAALRGRRRARSVARARQVACWMLAHHTGLSLPAIGARLGGRDHTSVLYGLRRAEALRDADTNFAGALDRCAARLAARRPVPSRDKVLCGAPGG